MNPQELKSALDTPEIHSLVNSYLLIRAYAETMRAQVDKIHDAIMQEIPVYADDIEGRRARSGQRIEHVSDLYLTSDNSICARIYAECDKRLRAAGLKPHNMDLDFCPALVAEDELRKVQRVLVDTAGKPLDLSADSLLCSSNGLDNYRKFTDLVIGAIVNLPNFKRPQL